jgi:hypothetical protein
MTTFDTNAYTDLNSRGRQMQKARAMADAEVWKLTDLLPRWAGRIAPDPQKENAKAERRAAARRTVDNLLR